MPGKYLPDDPAVLEAEIAPKTYLGTQDPDALDAELGFSKPQKPLKSREELNALPFLERQEAKLQQVALRYGANFAEALVNMGITVLDEAMTLKTHLVNTMLTPERLQEMHADIDRVSRESGLGGIKPLKKGQDFPELKHKPLPKVHFVRAFEEVGSLIEPSVVEEISGDAGQLHGWLASFAGAAAATGATGVAAYALNSLGLAGLTVMEMRREERLTGHQYSDEEKRNHALFSAAAGLGGPLVGKGITKGLEKALRRPLGKLMEEAISNTSLGAIFEGGGAMYEGYTTEDPEFWKRTAAGVIAFNMAHLQGALFAGPMRPRTEQAQRESFLLTAEIADKVDLGMKPRKGRKADGSLSPEIFERLQYEQARNWYQNITSPVVGDVVVNVNPRTLVEIFGIPMEAANRIVQTRFNAEEVRWHKFEQAREEMAYEQGGPDAVMEVRLRRAMENREIYDADPITYDKYMREKRKFYTQEELDAMYPSDAQVAERLSVEAEFRDRIDGFGDRNEVLRRRQREAEVDAANAELRQTEGPFENETPLMRDAKALIEFMPNEGVTDANLFPSNPYSGVRGLAGLRGVGAEGQRRTGGLTDQEIQARERVQRDRGITGREGGQGRLEPLPTEERVTAPRSVESPRRMLTEGGDVQRPPATAEQQAAAGGRRLENIGPDKGPGAIRGTPEQAATTRTLASGETVPRTQRGEAGTPKGRPADRARRAAEARAEAKEAARTKKATKAAEAVSEPVETKPLEIVNRAGEAVGGKVIRKGAKLPVTPKGDTIEVRPAFLSPSTYTSDSVAQGMLTKAKKKNPSKALAVIEVETGKYRIAELKPFKSESVKRVDTVKARESVEPVKKESPIGGPPDYTDATGAKHHFREGVSQPAIGHIVNVIPKGFDQPVLGRQIYDRVAVKVALDAIQAANPGKKFDLRLGPTGRSWVIGEVGKKHSALDQRVLKKDELARFWQRFAEDFKKQGGKFEAEKPDPDWHVKQLKEFSLHRMTQAEINEFKKARAEAAEIERTLKEQKSVKELADERLRQEEALRNDPEVKKELEKQRRAAKVAQQARKRERAKKEAKEANEPLNRFERELYDYIEKNPSKTPEEVREALGDVKSSETTTKKWVGVSKAFLGERQSFLRGYEQTRAKGKPKKREGESNANYKLRTQATGSFDGVKVSAKKENFLKWLREQPDEYFGGNERKERFIEEELYGGFSARADEFSPQTPASEVWNAKRRTPSEWTAEEAAFVERISKMKPEERAALAETEIELYRDLQSHQSDKPPLDPKDMKLPLLFLGIAGGAAAYAKLKEDERENYALAGLGFLAGIKAKLRNMRRNRSGVTVVGQESTVERWTAKALDRPLPKPLSVPKDTPKPTKPTEKTMQKVDDAVNDVIRKQVKRELEAAGGKPLDYEAPIGRRRLSLVESKFKDISGPVTETLTPVLFSMEHHFGKHGRVFWMITNKALMRAQVEKREAQFRAQEAGDWDVALSKSLTPKNIAKGQRRSDYDNQNDILLQLHEKVQRPIELQAQIDNSELHIRNRSRAPKEVHYEVIRGFKEEQAAALAVKVDKPNNDKIAAQVLATRSRMWNMPMEFIADAWGIEITPKIRKLAEQRRALEEFEYGHVLQNSLDAFLPMYAWTKGPYGPANQAKWTYGPETSDAGLVGPALKKWQAEKARADKATDLMAKNLVYRTRNNRNPIGYEAARELIERARHSNDVDPFQVEGLSEKGKKRLGNLDNSKVIDIIVGTESDWGRIMKSYIEPAIDRINHARAYGPDGKIARDLVEKAHLDGWDALENLPRLHDAAWGALTHRDFGKPSAFLREATGLVTIGTMGLSGPAQLTSYVRPLLEVDTRSFMRSLIPAGRAQIYQSRAMRKVFPEWFIRTFGSKDWAEFVSHMGTMAQSEAVSAMVDMGGRFPALAAFMLKNVYGTSAIDRMGRNIGAISGNFSTKKLLDQNQKLIQDGKVKEAEKKVHPYLKEIFGEFAGRDGAPGDPFLWDTVLSGNYSPAEQRVLEFIGGQIIGDRASGRTFAADMPLNFHHPLLGPIYKLAQFSYRQTHETYRQLNPKNPSSPLRNARTFDRLLRGLAWSTVGAALVIQIRTLMKGEDALTAEEVWNIPFIRKSLAYHGFAPLFLDFWGIARGDYGPYEEQAVGPVYSKIFEGIAAAFKTADSGESVYMKRFLIDLLPQSWWNTLGAPNRKELKEEWAPYKSTRRRRAPGAGEGEETPP